MPRTYRPMLLALLAVLACFVFSTSAQVAFQEEYCSHMQTGTNDVYTWDFQSNGNCTNHCRQEGNFAFAVVQWKDCFCSDYIPADQADLSECGVKCPGFPSEHCGDVDNNFWLYLKLAGTPSGTASSTGSKPTSPASSKRPPQSSQSPEQEITSLSTTTKDGTTVVQTIIQTLPANPTSSTAPVRTGNGDSGPNVGAIAGGVAGGIVGLLAIIGLFVFLLWRRRKQQRQNQDGEHSSGITRNTSTMSKAGLLGRATEVEKPYPSRNGTNNSRHTDNSIAVSPTSNRRNSQPILVDSRLNPNAMVELTYAHENVSRDSLASVDDSRDYGRRLNVRNPDP